jgi:hypothetical protein
MAPPFRVTIVCRYRTLILASIALDPEPRDPGC